MIVPQKSSKKVPYGQKKARHRQIHSDLVFALALCAMLASEGDLNRATVWFKKVAPRPRPQHLKEFLLRVWNRYKDGAIPISARAPPKRRKKINKEEAEHAGDLLLQGTQGRSGWRPLANAKEVSIFQFFWPRRHRFQNLLSTFAHFTLLTILIPLLWLHYRHATRIQN